MAVAPQREALVVAGLSARAMAESARQGGWRVLAMDLFGDHDTRRASARWWRIGDAEDLAIDPARFALALAEAADEPEVAGWVAGPGFEAQPDLLDAAPAGLPLIGMPAPAVRRVRDPRHFFGTLDALNLTHPTVRFDAPVDPAGWLAKRAGGSGGLHIATAEGATVRADTYWQRQQPGRPMSALFLADGAAATLVALNDLLVRPLGAQPHVYHGAVGPARDAALEATLAAALAALVPALALRGLASLDFIAGDGGPWLLEINPRPSASMVLHAQSWPAGLMRAHAAAVGGQLATARARAGVRGTRIVYAATSGHLDVAALAALADLAHVHDVPAAPQAFEAGAPVCSVTADAADADAVTALLEARADDVLARLAPGAGAAPSHPFPETSA